MVTRREAFRTLGMGGALGAISAGAVYAATPTVYDPSLAFFGEVDAIEAEMRVVKTHEEERPILARYNAIMARIREGDFPSPTTAEGAAKALRRTVVDSEFLDPIDRGLVLAALRFLDREAA